MTTAQNSKKRPLSNPAKYSLTLSLALLSLWCSSAHAFWASIPVNRTNMDSTVPGLRIVSTHYGTNNSSVNFSIFVLVKNKSEEELFSGHLDVKDTNKKIVLLTPVQPARLPKGITPGGIPKSWTNKFILFQFAIDTDYLANSEFSLDNTSDPVWGTGGVAYHFNLKEFDQPQ